MMADIDLLTYLPVDLIAFNRQSIFNNYYDIRIIFLLQHSKKEYSEYNIGVQRQNLISGKVIFFKSEKTNYRKHIIIEILKTGNNSSIKWRRRAYVFTYCLGNIVDISNLVLYCQFQTLH